jgi:hypothetical protein
LLNQLQAMEITVNEDLAGLKRLIAQQVDIEATIAEMKNTIVRDGRSRQRERTKPGAGGSEMGERGGKQTRMLSLPRYIATSDQLNALIEQLLELRREMAFAEFDVTLTD